MKQAKKITEAQIFLTRGCNIKCGYCKLARNGPYENELGLNDWKLAMMNLQALGYRSVKIMGGEPTHKDWLPELIAFSRQNTDLNIAVLSNGHFEDSFGESLGRAGLMGIFGSVDGIDKIVSAGQDAEEKAVRSFRMLQKAKEWGIPLRASNTVINRQNIEQIPEIVRRLSGEGIYVNLCPIIWTTDERKGYAQQVPDELKLKPEDARLVNHVMMILLQMKLAGAKITVPDSYLINASRYGINVDWQCTDLVQLRIDADGALMLCNEFRTELADRYNIAGLTRTRYPEFLEDWRAVRQRTECG
ncbi:MAG: radical SAM protein, partial [Candidatus Woesearchaeota archaeon]